MNYTVILGWKFAVAIGAAFVGIILALKMDTPDAKEMSIRMVDACKEY